MKSSEIKNEETTINAAGPRYVYNVVNSEKCGCCWYQRKAKNYRAFVPTEASLYYDDQSSPDPIQNPIIDGGTYNDSNELEENVSMFQVGHRATVNWSDWVLRNQVIITKTRQAGEPA